MIKALLFTFFFSLPLVAAAQPTSAQVHAAVKQAGGPERFLVEVARQTAQSLPQMSNKNLQIQSVSAIGRKLAYTAVLVNVEARLGQDIESLKQKNVSYLVCGSASLGTLIKYYDAEVTYYYTARNTEFLFQHSLDRRSCDGRYKRFSGSDTSGAPSEVDFLMLMSPPHASEIAGHNRILQAHPDALEISRSDNFRSWALSTPETWSAIRNHDTDGLIAVFYDFKSRK